MHIIIWILRPRFSLSLFFLFYLSEREASGLLFSGVSPTLWLPIIGHLALARGGFRSTVLVGSSSHGDDSLGCSQFFFWTFLYFFCCCKFTLLCFVNNIRHILKEFDDFKFTCFDLNFCISLLKANNI